MPRKSLVHYIAPTAISITPNCNGTSSDLAVYLARDTKIRVNCQKAGIGVDDNSSTYQEWTLSGRNRRLADSTRPYTIYARLRKTDNTDAYLVFVKQQLVGGVWKDKYPYVIKDDMSADGLCHDVYGEESSDYYYIRLGDVSLPVDSKREVTLDTGILGTDQYNEVWNENPDSLPLRVELSATVDDEDAGPTPYVYWEQTLQLAAALIKGWNEIESAQLDHWEILRNSGDAAADAEWPGTTRAQQFAESGVIALSHSRYSDDFNGAVSATFTVNAWGYPDTDSSGTPQLQILKSATICIMAETLETFDLVRSSDVVTYHPTTDTYTPEGGVDVYVRATDQKGDIFNVTVGQYTSMRLAMSYARVGSDVWTEISVSGQTGQSAKGEVPASAFTAKESIIVRLTRTEAGETAGTTVEKEVARCTIAMVSDGEDSKYREWIYRLDVTTGYDSKTGTIGGDSTKPISGKTGDDWNADLTDNFVPTGWSDHAVVISEQHPIAYTSSRDYDYAADKWGDFSQPVPWSKWGDKGTDGDGVQYLYKLFDHELTDAERTSNIPANPTFNNTTKKWEATGWSDDPQAPTSGMQYCYCSVIQRINGQWGSFQKLGLWSRYSLDGIDLGENLIDGTGTARVVDSNSSSSYDASTRWFGTSYKLCDKFNTIPDNTPLSCQMRIKFENCSDLLGRDVKLWINNTHAGQGLPSGVDAYPTIVKANPTDNGLYEVKMENFTINSGGYGWGLAVNFGWARNISNPASDITLGKITVDSVKLEVGDRCSAWSLSEKDKIGLRGDFKSTVFKRTNTTPVSAPTGGSYDSPVPSGWSDGIPDGEAMLWASSCTFHGDGTSTGWSTPKQMTDTADFDVDYSSVATNPGNPTDNPANWSNTASSTTIWMATRECHNGVWSAWQVSKIKGEKGDSITKSSETYRYATNNTGVRPAADSQDWQTTKPTLNKGYWLYTETTITWSDNSTTILYTDERNPNDGIAGQDIIVDGSTVMKYYVGDSNTTHPADDSSDWKDLSQVTQTQGKWLWSQATTYFRKASSTAGSHDAGTSYNYNVSYISKDGKTGRGISSITEYYQATNSSAARQAPTSETGWDTDPNLSSLTDKWDQNHKYLWNMEKTVYSNVDGTSTTEYSIPQILAIWTKDGAAGKGIDSITNYYKVTNNTTTPSKPATPGTDGWSTTPTAPSAGQYLWNYEVITWVNPSSTTETDVQMIGHSGTDGANAKYITVNGSCYPGSGSTPAAKVIISNGSTTTTVNWSDCAADATTSHRRGLALVTIKKSDLSVGTKQFYDTYNGRADALATAINAVTNDYFICLMSYDAVGWSDNLIAALKGCGSRGVENQTTGRYPFAFIGCKGLPEGYAFQMQGTLQQTTTVDLTAYVAEGALVATLDGLRGDFKSTVFKRTNTTPVSAPTGGDYDHPVPSGWEDGIPDGEAMLWASACTFHGDGTSTGWSTPKQMTDTADFDVEYSSVASSPGNPTDNPSNWSNTASSSTIWMATRECHNGTWSSWQVSKIKGEQGYTPQKNVDYFDGKDSVNVILSPTEVLVTQDTTSPYDIDLTNAFTDVSLNKGGTPDTNFTITDVTGTNCTASLQSGTKRIKISAISQSGGQYYDNGYVLFKVTYDSKTYNMRFNFYANLLGTWKASVEGGVSTVVASVVDYNYLDNALTKNNRTYTQTASAAGSYDKWTSDSSSVSGSKADMIQKTTTAQQTADGVVTEVTAIKAGKNMLKGALSANNWLSENSVPYTTHPGMVAPVVDDDGWFNVAASNHYYMISGGITLTKNKWYVLSLSSQTRASFGVKVWKTASSASSWVAATTDPSTLTIPAISSSASLSTRRKVAFQFKGDTGTYVIAFNVTTLRYPQLELGVDANSEPTAFEVDSAEETSSRISQSATEIDATITTKLGETGININGTTRTIKLLADKVNFYDSTGTNLNSKIWLDPTTGALHAVDGEFEGTVKATNFFHNVVVHGDEVRAFCTSAFFNTYRQYSWVNNFTYGKYYTKDEVYQLSNGVLGDFPTEMSKCTYDADIAIVPHGSSDTAGVSVNLPLATDFDGKLVEIVDTRYTQSSASPVGGLTVYQCDGASKMRGTFGATAAQYVRLNSNNSHDGGNYRMLSYEGYWVRLSTIGNPT